MQIILFILESVQQLSAKSNYNDDQICCMMLETINEANICSFLQAIC